MSDTYTANQGWIKQGTGDTNWGTVLNTILDEVDALGGVGPLSVKQAEEPTSTSLNVKISAGSYRKSDGTIVQYGGTTSVAMTSSSTNYVYLTDAGVLTVNTTGFPASTNIVRLAVVVAGGTTITSVTDARVPFGSYGAQEIVFAAQAANTGLLGPASGGSSAPTFRTFVDADLATTHAALTNAVAVFAGGFGVYRRVPGSYPYTVVAGDGWVEVDSSSARTINLDAASSFSAGEVVVVLDGTGNAGTNAVTVAPHGTDNINGANTSVSISSNNGWIAFYSDGSTNWHALAGGSAGGGGGSVSSVANTDSSLTISPSTGSVIASINPGYSNTWTVAQTFAPTSTTAVPLTANAPSGTTVNAFQVLINGTAAAYVSPKGSFAVGNAALATSATDGFIYAPSCPGVPTGTATGITGLVPLVIDTADGRLYGNWSGSWHNLTPSVGTISIGTTTVTSGTSGYFLYDNGGVVGNVQYIPLAHGGTGLDASAASNGQLLIGNGSGFSLAALTAGTGISVTNGGGTITISVTAAALTVGTSSIGSGTSGDLLYDNAGTLGNVGLAGSQGLSLAISGGYVLVQKTPLHSDTDGATVTFDMSVSDLHTVTLGGNRTLAVSNDTTGLPFTIVLVQDATGSRTVTWWSGIKWPGGTPPTLTATASKADVFTFIKTGAGAYYGFAAGQSL